MMLRSFIAIACPAGIQEVLGKIQEDLKHSIGVETGRHVWPMRWVRPEGIHLTLRFLGEVDASQLDAIQGVMARASCAFPVFQARVSGAGVFPNRRSPRVIWVGVQSDQEILIPLQQRIEEGLEAMGFQRERQQFHPHLTLARIRPERRPKNEGNGRSLLEEWLLQNGQQSWGDFPVHSIHLMRSQLRPGGAVYSSLAKAELGKPSTKDQPV